MLLGDDARPDAADGKDADGKDAAGKDAAGASGQLIVAIPAAGEACASGGEPGGEKARPRSLGAQLLDYSAHVAMIVGLIGFAWTLSNHVISHPSPADPSAAQALAAAKAPAAKPDPVAAELAALKDENLRLAADLGGMRARIGALESADARVPAQLKSIQSALAEVRKELAGVRGDVASRAAEADQRLDRLARERGGGDFVTGSMPPAGAPRGVAEATAAPSGSRATPSAPGQPTPVKSAPDRLTADKSAPGKPAVAQLTATGGATGPAARGEGARTRTAMADAAAGQADAQRRGNDGDKAAAAAQPVIAGYVVRDVERGVALIEGRRGMLEVVPGVSIPGAGVVKSIERRGRGWAVITTRGQLAYAAPPVDRRGGGRGYDPAYRYDF